MIKTLGDEVMVVGPDAAALASWAVDLQAAVEDGQPAPRIGLHYGEALYRDGDYFGREVNQAARVVARAGGGEVLVTRPVVELADGVDGLQFTLIGEVSLKGFSEPTELFTAVAARGLGPVDPAQVREAVRESGLFARDRPVLAMISAGRDSTCLLDVAVALLGAGAVAALHVNYGLREDAARGRGALPRALRGARRRAAGGDGAAGAGRGA